jgi:hypothetical protein
LEYNFFGVALFSRLELDVVALVVKKLNELIRCISSNT